MSEYTRPKAYRKALGFNSQTNFKQYCKATDIKFINWELVEAYNERLIELFSKINSVICDDYKMTEEEFSVFKAQMHDAYTVLREYKIIEDLFTNNGRPRESVYFNWMRGYLVASYFRRVVACIFFVAEDEIEQLGEDNLQSVKANGNYSSFKKEALADLQITRLNIHIEIQAGFTGENDIKRSKAMDARRRKAEGWDTYVLHFDLYNGKLAIINITDLFAVVDDKWIKNDRFEGVYTVKIPSEAFKWDLEDTLQNLNALSFTIK